MFTQIDRPKAPARNRAEPIFITVVPKSQIPSDEHPRLPPSSSIHIPSLDGVRGLAILLVLVFHWTLIENPTTPLAGLFRKFAEMGWIGVDLFFVLSGFLITGILLDAKARPHYFRNFYARRILRIFPLNYAFLLVFLVILPFVAPAFAAKFGSPPRFTFPYWLYLSNFENVIYSPRACPPLGALWSLATEEQFYLIWPLIVLLLSPKSLARLCIALAIMSPLLRGIWISHGADFNFLNNIPICHMDSLLCGSFLAVAQRTGTPAQLIPVSRALIVFVPLLLVILDLAGGTLQKNSLFLIFGFTVISLFFGALLILTLRKERPTKVFNAAWLRCVGRRSYALYLINLPVKIFVQDFIFDPVRPRAPGLILPGVLLFWAISFAIAAPIAWASWHLLEKHFLRLKVAFPMAGRPIEAQRGSAIAPS